MSKMKREYDWQGTGLARNWAGKELGRRYINLSNKAFFFFLARYYM